MLLRLFTIASAVLLISGCAGMTATPAYSDRAHDEMYRKGSVISRDGGWAVMGGAGATAGVDPQLWRAALATVAALPVTNADQASGVIDTDWDSAASADTRTRLHIVVTDHVQVTQLTQTRVAGNWTDAPDNGDAAQTMQAEILRRAGR